MAKRFAPEWLVQRTRLRPLQGLGRVDVRSPTLTCEEGVTPESRQKLLLHIKVVISAIWNGEVGFKLYNKSFSELVFNLTKSCPMQSS